MSDTGICLGGTGIRELESATGTAVPASTWNAARLVRLAYIGTRIDGSGILGESGNLTVTPVWLPVLCCH